MRVITHPPTCFLTYNLGRGPWCLSDVVCQCSCYLLFLLVIVTVGKGVVEKARSGSSPPVSRKNSLWTLIKREGMRALHQGPYDSCCIGGSWPACWRQRLLAAGACLCDPRRKEVGGGVVMWEIPVQLLSSPQTLVFSIWDILRRGIHDAGLSLPELRLSRDIRHFCVCPVGGALSCPHPAAGSHRDSVAYSLLSPVSRQPL